MNTFKMARLALVALWMFACGAPLEEDEQLDLGQVEQGFSVETNGYGWRSDIGANNLKQCSGSDATQVCNVPGSKSLRVQLDTTGMASQDVTKAQTQRDALISAYNTQFSGDGWTVSSVTSNATLKIAKATLGNLGGVSDIRQFLELNCVGFTTLTETVSGTYRACSSINAFVDYDKLFGTFGDSGMNLAIKHVLGVAMQARLGIGVQSSDSSRISFRTVSGTSARNSTMTNTEKCRVRALVTGGGSVSFTNNC